MKVRLIMTGGALFLLALTGGAIQAQDRGQDQDHQDQGRHQQIQHDQYREDQHGQDHSRFDDHDRQVTRDWYNGHRDHPPLGLRDRDRLTPEYESRLREGDVLRSGHAWKDSPSSCGLLSPFASSAPRLSLRLHRRTRGSD